MVRKYFKLALGLEKIDKGSYVMLNDKIKVLSDSLIEILQAEDIEYSSLDSDPYLDDYELSIRDLLFNDMVIAQVDSLDSEKFK